LRVLVTYTQIQSHSGRVKNKKINAHNKDSGR
jgi:hypothetical protein